MSFSAQYVVCVLHKYEIRNPSYEIRNPKYKVPHPLSEILYPKCLRGDFVEGKGSPGIVMRGTGQEAVPRIGYANG